MANDYLGEFEHLVLLAVMQLGDNAYGAPIRQLIAERAERDVSFGAVYSTLRRLDDACSAWRSRSVSAPPDARPAAAYSPG